MNIFINSLFYRYYQTQPIRLVDVGASGGLSRNWKRARKYLKVVGFEPDIRSFRDLEKDASPERIYINSALYKDKKTVDFYFTKNKQLSSFFVPKYNFLKQFPESERFEVSGTSKIDVDTLDSQLGNHCIDDVDFIKLDSQGSELFILEGAVKTLDDVFGLEIEAEFSQMYTGQPLFCDVDKLARNFGFQLFDLRPCYWKREAGKFYGGTKGQLIFADALYFLSLDRIKKRLKRLQNPGLEKSKVLRSISIALLYGYIDYALAIFEQEKRLFDAKEIKTFYREIKKNIYLSTRIPNFRGKGKIAGLFKMLHSLFRYSHNNWSIAQEHLGNLE